MLGAETSLTDTNPMGVYSVGTTTLQGERLEAPFIDTQKKGADFFGVTSQTRGRGKVPAHVYLILKSVPFPRQPPPASLPAVIHRSQPLFWVGK